MTNRTDCQIISWSKQLLKTSQPIFYICIFASISHLLFRIQLQIFPAAHKRSMQWVYAYLTTDLFLLARFFLLYAYRRWPTCIHKHYQMILCYFEAIFDNYLNLVQSYILLALNICRYLQIAHHYNVYISNRRLILLIHLLIYLLPLIGYSSAIFFREILIENQLTNICRLVSSSFIIRIVVLLFSYLLPVILTLIFLLLSLNHIRNTNGIQAQEILDARQKYHRQLVLQSTIFYSLWLLLWSPYLLLFPFSNTHSTVNMIVQILRYTNITLDPITISALDVRFLQVWRSTSGHLLKRSRRKTTIRTRVITASNSLEYSLEYSLERTMEHSITVN